MTPWYPGTINPMRDGAYLCDYSSTSEGGWHLDYWLTNGTDIGFWYVNEPNGEWNDAWYTELPWRGLTKSEWRKEK